MSGSDDRKGLLEGLGDLDWDSALDEWEKKAFDPAVAPDIETDKKLADTAKAPKAPAPPPPVAGQGLAPIEDIDDNEKTRVPTGYVAPVPRESAPASPSLGTFARSPNPPAVAPTAKIGRASEPTLSTKAPEGTLIAPVPNELRGDRGDDLPPRDRPSDPNRERGSAPPARPSAPPSMGRGGLDQLWSRPSRATPGIPLANLPKLGPQKVAPPAAEPLLPHEERESERTLVKQSPREEQERERASARAVRGDSDPFVGGEEVEDLPSGDIDTGQHGPLPKVIPAAGRPASITDDESDNETVIRDRDSLSDADTATRLPADDEMPTIGRPSNIPSVPVPSSLGIGGPTTARDRAGPAPEGPMSFEGERPVSRWLDEQKTNSFRARVVWLEEEARAIVDPIARGRALLAVSELAALVGDRERAYRAALEARDAAPSLPLTWRQTRQLASTQEEPQVLAEELDAEAAHSPTPASRVHATLLAADVLRINDLGDAAVDRWESACKLDPADTRAPIARAALALAQDDHTSGALRLADNSELISLDKAVATALRLRGVERSGAEVEEMPINDGLRHARNALNAGDPVAAAQAISEIAQSGPELAKGALWLSAAIGAAHIASRRSSAKSLKTLTQDGDKLARRQLAARGVELGDPDLVKTALGPEEDDENAFDPAERALLEVLAGKGDIVVNREALKALAVNASLSALEDALYAIAPVVVKDEDDHGAVARARRTAGTKDARALATLGRLLGSKATDLAIDEALEAISEPRPATAAGVAIESAVRSKRYGELSEALSSLPSDSGDSAQRHIAAAIVAERANNRERAKEAWAAASRGDALEGRRYEGLIRIAADMDREIDLGAELLSLADDMPDGVPSAILRLEALARNHPVPDEEQAPILERVHRAAPLLGIGAFLAERVGRRRGDLDEVLRWIQERRSYATGPLETALDAVREALLVADRDSELASTRLEEAHRARPDDVALRELHERLAPEPPTDRGSWREKRAESATGSAAALLWIEAALEHERAGDYGATLHAARKAAEQGDRGLSRPMIERSEIETGETTRITEDLMEVTKNTDDETIRREALERLVFVDAYGKKDSIAALLWHRAILENTPHHKPSLRWVEHALISEGRDDELAPIFENIALALDGTVGGETAAHAQHAARLRAREVISSVNPLEGPSAWERTHDMARLGATQPEPSLWALRALNAHARARKDEDAILTTTLALLERTQRAPERASLLLRSSESAARLEKVEEARTYLERAATEDPGDVVTWGFLAEVRERAGDTRQAAEACESLARTSVVREHQLLAWHDAAKIWIDEVKEDQASAKDRAMACLEAAAEIDVTYADVFPRLSAIYADKRLDSELASLLEKRLATIQDDNERVGLEVELSRAFAEMGEIAKAKTSLESALEKRPDHTAALSALADLCTKEQDWTGAEQAYVRLARLLTDDAEQKSIYERLGEIYATHAPNLPRAETAFKEVLKRSPGDMTVLAKLVDVYKRSADVGKAVATQQEIIGASTDPEARLLGLVELAKIHETVGRDPRRSEQVLDSARKEFPTSVIALRSMAEFYSRQRQMPAMQILLDRAAGDARRSFAQGRFVPSLFQVLHAAFELRGKRDAARVVAATLAAVEGQESELMGAEARAVDPRLDDLLAPDAMSPPLRALLFRAGDALDAVMPIDLRAVKAAPLQPGTPIGATVGSVATVIGLGALQILVSPTLGRVALPLATNPPTLLVGEALAKVKNERARMFIVVRAMKMILSRASALLRGSSTPDVAALVAGLFCAFNPSYVPQAIEAKRVQDLARRIGPSLPRNLDPTVGVIALEAAGMVGTSWNAIAPAAAAWANRVALLAVGDPNAALDALAWGRNEDAAPTGSEERAAWIARHPEARDLMTFSVTDAYAEARVRLGLDK
jgi:cellulose synthase operon protein C